MATGWQNYKALEILCLRIDNWGKGEGDRGRERERTHKPGIIQRHAPVSYPCSSVALGSLDFIEVVIFVCPRVSPVSKCSLSLCPVRG